jgi:hypothetical protein
MRTNLQLLATGPQRHYWFRWITRPETGLVGWTLQADHLNRPIRQGGYHSVIIAGAWDTPDAATATQLALAALPAGSSRYVEG